MAPNNNKAPATAKHAQIDKASTQTFAAVTVAAIVVSMSLVLLNILWGTSRFNTKVQGELEIARDALQTNLERVGPLQESFNRFEIGDNLIPDQEEEKKNSELVLDALPSKFDFPELAASINNLAEEAGVELSSFNGTDLGSDTSGSSSNPRAQEIPFSMRVVGSYSGISKFLRGIENSIRPITVLSIDLTGSSSNLQASVTAETVYQPAVDLTIQKETIQ